MIIWCLRYWYAVVSTVLSLILFAIIEFANSTLFVLGISLVYILLLSVVYHYVYGKSVHKITVATTLIVCVLGAVGLLLLIELETLRQLFAVFLSIVIGAIYYIPQRFSAQLAHEYKPWRRMFVSIMTLGVCSVVITLYGLDMFFQFPMIGWYALACSAITSCVAYAIFRLYYPRHSRRMLVWTLVLSMLSFQSFLTISYLPLGYLWLGLVYIWLWYGTVTLIRFHLSSKGVIWKKQQYFLIGSLISFILLLALAQWV